MKLVIIMTLLLFCMHDVYAQAPEEDVVQNTEQSRLDLTVDDLIFDCKKCVNFPKGRECTYCDAMLTGVAATLGMLENGKNFCPPGNLDTRKVRNFFRKWALFEAKVTPEIMDMHAVQGVVEAMRKSFPCKSSVEK